ncbi:hypothetical protein [Vibrio hangzhouensis]|uniref:Outer membrane protein beta-barrel domain-containing protein n=1 Tax=Vibrio hangzhouensis TaxID=462991 RepID=A0A1H5ZVA1_9VIBR|nr:hypothetical protein [Vibrio hangzhouensis]SEG39904.1 hypothetical protein SAMN04488244_11315 [Vibrio hangzhouensis]
MKIKISSIAAFAVVSTLSFGAFASATAGGEEQWQIVEENQAPASTQAAAKPSNTQSKPAANSSNRSSRSSGGNSGFKIGMGLDQGLSIVGQINNTVNFAVGNDGIAADYIFSRGRFDGDVPFNWYAGVGGQIQRSDKFGPRVALGVELPFAKSWDAYAQLTPNLMFDKSDLKLGIGAGIGVRYSF